MTKKDRFIRKFTESINIWYCYGMITCHIVHKPGLFGPRPRCSYCPLDIDIDKSSSCYGVIWKKYTKKSLLKVIDKLKELVIK